MMKITVVGSIMILLCLSFSAAESPVLASTPHCGTLTKDETWSSDQNIHVITCDVLVMSGVTLTIRDRAIVKFEPEQSLRVAGTLRIIGTGERPIYLTSIRDDAIGGDTNNDGPTLPQPGDWSRIEFQDSSYDANSLINHVQIRYGGCCQDGAITLLDASPTIRHTTIRYSGYYPIRIDLLSAPDLSDITLIDNVINALAVEGGTIIHDTTWKTSAISYYLLGTITVNPSSSLTIQPDVVVKFQPDTALIIQGALQAEGTADQPLFFTSYKDQTVGGNTSDDRLAPPQPGDWSRIEFQDSSLDDNSIISHAQIRYSGGCCDYGAITLLDASPTINYTTITHSHAYAVYAEDSQPIFDCNNIFDNNAYGVYNATPLEIMVMQNTWWGSESGPYHKTTNVNGTGDEVTDGVVYLPWRPFPCQIIPFQRFLPLIMQRHSP